MGYISLTLNAIFLMYIGVFAAVPLVFLVHSFRPTLPWSCEGFELWAPEEPHESGHTICNLTEWQQNNETSVNTNSYHIPSVLFFRTLFSSYDSIYEKSYEKSIAWSLQLVVAMFVVWALIAIFFYKNNIKRTSLYIRYTIWILVLLLLICAIRFTYLEGSKNGLQQYFYPSTKSLLDGLFFIPIYASAAFGAGWGVVISLSSYNKFTTNIMRYSWIICVGQVLIFMLYGLVATVLDSHLRTFAGESYHYYIEEYWIMYLSSGWVMSNLELPNLWCILFFSFLTLGAMLMMTIQLFSLLTAIFDNFEHLSQHKQKVTFGLIGFLFLSSIYFSSSHGLKVFNALAYDILFSQTALNLLLILVVLWIYGRERFQRDFQFMLTQPFATWRVNILRFVAAIVMLYTLVLSLLTSIQEHLFHTSHTQALVVGVIALILIALPWLFLPGYSLYRMSLTTGSVRLRLKRCCQPIDWHPIEAEYRQRYEEAIDNMGITQPLSTVGGQTSEI